MLKSLECDTREGHGSVVASLLVRTGLATGWSCVRIQPTPVRKFGNSICKSHRSLLSGVVARGSKTSHTEGTCVTCRGLHHSYRRVTLK